MASATARHTKAVGVRTAATAPAYVCNRCGRYIKFAVAPATLRGPRRCSCWRTTVASSSVSVRSAACKRKVNAKAATTRGDRRRANTSKGQRSTSKFAARSRATPTR